MKKRILAAALALLLLLSAALADYWPEGHELACREGRIGCQILQMVMMGAFTEMDPDDRLCVRVYAASLPRLTALTAEDKAHFMQEHGVAEDELTRCLHIAVGHCLWAEILANQEGEGLTGDAQSARQIALLFLETADTPRAVEERAIIRSGMTDELTAELAKLLDVDAAFLDHIFFSDDWRDAHITETE